MGPGHELALRKGLKESAAGLVLDAAYREAAVGNPRRASERAKAALALDTGRSTIAGVASTLAASGEPGEAERLLARVASKYSTDTLCNAVDVPDARAAIELARRQPQRAIETLRAAAPYDRGQLGIVLLRGRAYFLAGQPAKAATEFRKILGQTGDRDHEPVLPARPPLARPCLRSRLKSD